MAFLEDAFRCLSQRRDRSVIKDNDNDQVRRDNAGDPKPEDHASTMRIAIFHERLALGVATFSRADVEWLLDRLATVERERDEARTDVIRMAQTKVGDRCEHHREPLKVLEYYALKECPLCWMAEAKQAEAALLALRAALEEAVTTLNLILAEPHGCPMCDSGRLRNPNKQHWDNCGFAHAQALVAGVADQDGPRHE